MRTSSKIKSFLQQIQGRLNRISGYWMPLIDLALLATAFLMIVTRQTVLLFHVIFVLLSFGAFFWKLRGFILRTLLWVTLTTVVVLLAIQKGQTQTDELIEIPLLLSILLMVFMIASQRSKAQAQLEQHQFTALKQAENNSNSMSQILEQQLSESSNRIEELTLQNKELDTANIQMNRLATQYEALTQVTRSIASIRDLQELLSHVTTVISESFDFYHVGVFLIDEANEYAVLTASNSEGGRKMLERQHRLRVGEEGIVGNATASGKPRIALDVGDDAVFFNNPDLPETHSEMALPLRSGDKIVGALDVQSTITSAFTNDDVQTLSFLADQVSLAIENARLFEETQRALAEQQFITRQSTREAWKRLPEQQNLLGYRYNAMGASQLKELVDLTEENTDQKKSGQTGTGSFVVPIELRGEIIGNLVVHSPSGDEWNIDQRDLIKAVADRVALSAENARLFEETTQRAERERLVTDITSKIRSHSTPQAMIETAINELQSALGASRVEIIPQSTGKDSEV